MFDWHKMANYKAMNQFCEYRGIAQTIMNTASPTNSSHQPPQVDTCR